MNYIRIIPSLMLSNKKLVKGVKFKNHEVAGNPISTIKALESQKADEIILLDIDSYRKENKKPDLSVLKEIAKEINTPLTFGGGINNLEIAKKVIELGAEKIYLNRSVLNNKLNVKDLINRFGGQAIVIGLNIVVINGEMKIYEKQDTNLLEYMEKMQNIGVGEFKITFVDTEGTKLGLDIEKCKKLKKNIFISSIFEGGIGSLEHISDLAENKIDSIALGRILIFNDYNIFKIKTHLKNKNYQVRI